MADTPIRVLLTADAVGGVWQYATDLATGLAGQGVAPVLAVLGPAPDAEQRAMATGIPGLTLLETGLPLDWLSDEAATRAAAAELAAIARREAVDLIHLNSPALAAAVVFPVPVVAAAHGCLATWWAAARPDRPLDPAFRWHREMMARGLRASARVVAPSASYAEAVQRQYRLPASPHVVHNGRRFAKPAPSKPQHDCAFTAGRLWDEVKNVRVLDAAAALLPFPFHAAGAAVAPHGEGVAVEHLHLLGQLDGAAMSRQLSRRPVFVSAATFEPFGLAVLEAAAAGCPLVLSDIPTFRELWDGAAIFVAPDDAPGFAAAIVDSVEDQQLRRGLGEAARRRAADFSAERMAAGTAAHYRALLGGRLAA